MFQGNRGKTWTKESGDKGSSCAKGKQEEETLKPPDTPAPAARSQTEDCHFLLPLLILTFSTTAVPVLLCDQNI